MVREFYSERDPTIVLVDASLSMRTAVLGNSVFNAVTAELANFLLTARPAAGAIELISFYELRVLARIELRVGVENRELILREIVKIDTKSNLPKLASVDNDMNYEVIEREARSLERPGHDTPSRDRLNSFAERVLPFYVRAMRKRLS